MKIAHLIFLSIFIILLFFTITTVVNYNQSEEVRENAEYLAISSNIVRQSNQLQRNTLNMERDLTGYLATQETDLLKTFDSAFVENETLLAEISASITSDAQQQQKLNVIKDSYNRWADLFKKSLLLQTTDEKNVTPNASLPSLEEILREQARINKTLQQKFKELLNVEYKNRQQRRLILEKSEQQTKTLSVLLTALSIVIGFIIAVLLARHISRRILIMVSMANNIAAGNYKVEVKDKANDELSELNRSLNHMAKMLEENISLLKRKNRELDQFAYIVSHDLKAPLRGIDNLISWIIEDYAGQIPDKANEFLQLTKGRISRLENLIQGILNYSRIGRDATEKAEVDVQKMILEIIEDLPRKPGIKIEVEERMPVIFSEKLPLSQIFTNLLSNALKYHDKEKGTIKVYVKEEKDCYEFFVEDDGPGVAKEYHEKIFVIFQTLVPRDTFESTGVGLAIVKKILDERGEQIRIKSELGKGTTFVFTWHKK